VNLIARVRDDYGLALVSLDPVDGGADYSASVYRGVLDDGRAVAVKVREGLRTSGLRVAYELAGPGVVGPIAARSGEPFTSTDGVQLSVAPWISGVAAAAAGMDADQWRSFGALLARVHAARPGLAGLPLEDYRTPLAATVPALSERVRAADTADPLVRELVAAWLPWDGAIGLVAARTDALGSVLRAEPAAVVLCHGDAHTGNVLVGDDGQVWLLDWDEAVLAPPERDLMFVLGGVLADAQVGTVEQGWFFAGYGRRPAGLDLVRLAYYRCSWAVQDVASWAAAVLDPGGRDRDRALRFFLSLLWPTGIVPAAVDSLRQVGRA
jgi:spectinomycin phosphotransferase